MGRLSGAVGAYEVIATGFGRGKRTRVDVWLRPVLTIRGPQQSLESISTKFVRIGRGGNRCPFP